MKDSICKLYDYCEGGSSVLDCEGCTNLNPEWKRRIEKFFEEEARAISKMESDLANHECDSDAYLNAEGLL